MRIVSGKFKGRTIIAPGNLLARPTTDFAKEGLFNILNNNFDFESLKALDLFAGTGNISYELLSRGCTDIICVEGHAGSCKFIRETAEKLSPGAVKVVTSDVFRFLTHCHETYDLIFADPPYEMKEVDKVPQLVFDLKLLKPEGWLVLEHSDRVNFKTHPAFVEQRHYGKVNFSIFYDKDKNAAE